MGSFCNIALLVVATIGLWRLLCYVLRRRRSALTERLHRRPYLRHSHAILSNFAFLDFPFLFRRSLEFGLFRTYAIPSISSILFKAGHFDANASKRFDDTEILIKELLLHHVDGDRGSLAVRRLNFIHSQYKISNSDFLYVLAVFVTMPLEWISRYGYRELTEGEKLTYFAIWHDIGTRMGILEIPSTIKEFAAFKEDYECKHMVYTHTNHKIAEMTMNLFLSGAPRVARPIARRMVYAFMDNRLRKAMGYPKQPAWLSAVAHSMVQMHGWVVRWILPPRPVSWSQSAMRIPPGCPASQGALFNPADALYKLSVQRYKPYSYVEGYKIKDVGAMKPGCVGDAHPGELLLPLSQCSNVPWPGASLQILSIILGSTLMLLG